MSPPPTGAGPGQSRAGLFALAACISVLAVVATIAMFGRTTTPGSPSAADAGFVPSVDSSTGDNPYPTDEPTTVEPAPETPGETTPSPRDPGPTDAASALAELKEQLAADRPAVEALAEQWVPQLSAKRPGLLAKGVVYDYVRILADFRSTQVRYPDALLLFSGEYTSFKYGNFWITIVPQPHYDGPSANAWCDGQGIPWDDCYAKMISHTIGYDGATLLRGH